MFYNHLILSGTKIYGFSRRVNSMFYNHLILSGTKIDSVPVRFMQSFTIT